jgi:hypothetical protein
MLQLKVARLVLRVYTDKCTCSCDYDSRTRGVIKIKIHRHVVNPYMREGIKKIFQENLHKESRINAGQKN